MNVSKKLDVFPKQTFQASLMSVRQEPTLEWSTYLGRLGLTGKYYTRLERPTIDKHINLLEHS